MSNKLLVKKKYNLIEQSFRLSKNIKDFPLTGISKDELRKIKNKLIMTMVIQDGIGIAGPQIGFNYRIAVIEPRYLKDEIIINPTYEAVGEETVTNHESCLSVNKRRPYTVVRPAKIRATYYTLDKDYNIVFKETVLTHPDSTVFQHEVDHLNGLTINKTGKKLKGFNLF